VETVVEPFDLTRVGPPEWALDELADYIVDRHHRYAQGAIPALRDCLARAVDRFGAQHPALAAVQSHFVELADELEAHMAKEEHILFPAIRDLVRARRLGQLGRQVFATLLHPIRVMEDEHARATGLLVELRRDTGNYRPPSAGDAACRECYRQLATFDADLERHIGLENNLLFPRALDLERFVA
jgi:regulator of cell morphogenesis and NO signaling